MNYATLPKYMRCKDLRFAGILQNGPKPLNKPLNKRQGVQCQMDTINGKATGWRYRWPWGRKSAREGLEGVNV